MQGINKNHKYYLYTEKTCETCLTESITLENWNVLLENIKEMCASKYKNACKNSSEKIPNLQGQYNKWKMVFLHVYDEEFLNIELFLTHIALIILIRIIFFIDLSHRKKPTKSFIPFIKKTENDPSFLNIWNKLEIPSYYSPIIENFDITFNSNDKIFHPIHDHNNRLKTLALDPITSIYQIAMELETKQNSGEFYTDFSLAQLMIEESFHSSMRVLDPSCGSGVFLKFLVKHLIGKHYSDSRIDQIERIKQIEQIEQIWGIDINPLACIMARANILLTLPVEFREDARINIKNFNFLDITPDKIENLSSKFDLIIGNPPWLVLNRIQNIQLKNNLKNLGKHYRILEGGNLATSTEISTIFIYHALQNYLKSDGVLFFVVPASIMTAKQHQLFRQFAGMKQVEIWKFKEDQYRIHHICFKAQKCVSCPSIEKRTKVKGFHYTLDPEENGFKLFAQNEYQPAYIKQIELDKNSSILPIPQIKVGRLINNSPSMKNSTSKKNSSSEKKKEAANTQLIFPYNQSDYHDQFRQGASLVPRNLLFVDILAESQSKALDIKHQINENLMQLQRKQFTHSDSQLVKIQPSQYIQSKKYSTWDFKAYNREKIELQYIFPTAKSTGLIPYQYVQPYYSFIPYQISETETFSIGLPDSPKALKHYQFLETIYTQHQKSGAKIQTLKARIDYGHALSDPKQLSPFKIIYAGIGSIIKAAILRTPYIIDTSLYFYCPSIEEEAYYLLGYLNSSILTSQLKLVGSTGANGSLRNIHKHPLHFSLPVYDKTNNLHNRIVSLAQSIESSTSSFLAQILEKKPQLSNHWKSVQKQIFQSKTFQEKNAIMDDLILQLFSED